MVIWDSAPLLAADDAANLCSKMNAVLFVARARYSSTHMIASALDILAKRGAPVFGLVLNAVEPDEPGYYNRYRYKEYYATEVGT
jgi:Mrp family chromosome partitioning ATPase